MWCVDKRLASYPVSFYCVPRWHQHCPAAARSPSISETEHLRRPGILLHLARGNKPASHEIRQIRVRSVTRPRRLAQLSEPERRDFWEICEDRYQVRSTILTSQLPVSRWHEQIGDPTLADGILDRLVHNAHRIDMRGESMRKNRGKPNGWLPVCPMNIIRSVMPTSAES